jgi:TolA-binding protein
MRHFARKYRENTLVASALYTIGYIYNEQKRYDEAILEFSRALKGYPESTAAPALTLQLGIAYFNSGEYTSARRQFETLLVKFTAADNLAAGRFWLGKSYYAENKFAEALREFGAVLKDFPAAEEAGEALYLSALCKYRQKQTLLPSRPSKTCLPDTQNTQFIRSQGTATPSCSKSRATTLTPCPRCSK